MVDPRANYCTILAHGPLLPGDAIVVLSGDGETRATFAAGLYQQRGAPRVIVTGGLPKPPHSLTATQLAGVVMAKGVPPEAVIKAGTTAQNTWEEATDVCGLAIAHKWHRLLLVTSPHHIARAHLTFIAALAVLDATEKVHVIPVPTSQVRWWESPDGLTETRADLLTPEFAKIEEYHLLGHCASYVDGLAYLRQWEGK